MSPTTPSNTGSLKIGRPRSRSKSPFRSFRWKRGSSSRAADSDDEAGKIFIKFFFYFFNVLFKSRKCFFKTSIHFLEKREKKIIETWKAF